MRSKKRGLPLKKDMDELIFKLEEIIEDLVKLNKVTINLLAQYTEVNEYEEKLKKITQGDDVII